MAAIDVSIEELDSIVEGARAATKNILGSLTSLRLMAIQEGWRKELREHLTKLFNDETALIAQQDKQERDRNEQQRKFEERQRQFQEDGWKRDAALNDDARKVLEKMAEVFGVDISRESD